MRVPLARLLPRGLQVLGVNSVPVAGFFLADWSVLTALALYWCENVIGSLLIGLRLTLHRRWTCKRGYWEASIGGTRARKGSSGFVAGFLFMALFFSLGHGVFLTVFAFALPSEYPEIGGIEPRSLLEGVAGIGALLLFGLAIDLFTLRRWSFAEIRQVSERTVGRVVVVHLTIVLGMAALAMTGRASALFAVFASFKTLVDLSAVTPRGQPSAEAPGWLARVLGRVRSRQGEDFATFWRQSHEREMEKAARNEETI